MRPATNVRKFRARRGRTAQPKCYCGHAQRNHINGEGLCLVRSCKLCLIYRRKP